MRGATVDRGIEWRASDQRAGDIRRRRRGNSQARRILYGCERHSRRRERAGIDETMCDDTGERRADDGVVAHGFHLGAAGVRGAQAGFGLRQLCFGGVERCLRRGAVGVEAANARHLHGRVVARRARGGDGGCRLRRLGIHVTRVDANQGLAERHPVALVHEHFRDRSHQFRRHGRLLHRLRHAIVVDRRRNDGVADGDGRARRAVSGDRLFIGA